MKTLPIHLIRYILHFLEKNPNNCGNKGINELNFKIWREKNLEHKNKYIVFECNALVTRGTLETPQSEEETNSGSSQSQISAFF